MRMFTAALMTAFAALSLTPAQAQPSPSPQGMVAADPNQRICEDVVQTGSRIAAKRYCATRAEWAEKKKQDREAVEKAQMSPCMITHTSPTGRGAC